jgi:N-acetylated-alpha-linked acidic dipeptidase
VYLNRDSGAARGWFGASAVPSLGPFIREVARAVNDPEQPSKTLYDRWLEHAVEQERARGGQPSLKEPRIDALGSGSDFTAFLDHIGVAAADMGISGGGDGTYHSIYDDSMWFKRFVDPGFKYSVAASQVTGIALLRLADAELLPFDYEAYGKQILEYIGEIEKEATTASASEAGKVDFVGLRAAAERLTRAGVRARSYGESLLSSGQNPRALEDLNLRLRDAERELIEPAGLPDRPWFRHTIYAPGFYTGYGVKTIPGVREAVDAKNFGRAAEQARIVTAALIRASRRLEFERAELHAR